MDSKEASAYLATGEEQLKDAELAFRERRYSLCAFLAASSAENLTSALLVTLGAKPSRKHKNSLVLHRLIGGMAKDLQPVLREIVRQIQTIEGHITRSRYPILRGSELLPPSKFYTEDMARDALTRCRTTVESVKSILKS